MLKLLQYYSRYTTVRGNFSGLPGWARLLVGVAAIPGVLLIGLSILALLVSMAALLLLTVPVYRIVQWMSGGRRMADQTVTVSTGATYAPKIDPSHKPRRHVDVTIIE